MSRPGDRRHQRQAPDDKTVEVPLLPPRGAEPPPTEEPWWKNVNSTPAAPATPPQRAADPFPARRRSPQPIRRVDPPRSRRAQPTRQSRRRSRLPVLIAVGAVAILAGVAGLVLGLSRFDVVKGNVLDVTKVQAGVQRILTDPADGYGATTVTDVVCNDGADPEIKQGGTFSCDVVVDGRKRQVLVVFQDDNGTYEVDRPR